MSCAIKDPSIIGDWVHPATITKTDFKFKSLSEWVFNPTIGCRHGCRFCYVPSVAILKLKSKLAPLGVTQPAESWGDYVFVRAWNEKKFLASLATARRKPEDKLKPEGHRAIMLSSTCDPYQVFTGHEEHRQMVRRALELIRDKSNLKVRILTRSPLAREDFDLFKSFGDRLLFGMSLPTLDDTLAQAYEPHAPSPTRRLETLEAAKAEGINLYVAVAPTYPECGEDDLRKTLAAVAKLDPVTIFHEPINIKGENVNRIRRHGVLLGQEISGEVFASTDAWERYAMDQMQMVARIAQEFGVLEKVHFWPDQQLASKDAMARQEDPTAHAHWLMECWTKISAWPGEE